MSIAIHAGLVLLLLAAYRNAPDRSELMQEFVTFLVPPDNPSAQRGAEAVRWNNSTSEDPGKKGETGTGGASAMGTGPVMADSGDAAAPEPLSIDLPSLLGDSIHMEIDVDSAVERFAWSAAPEYPLNLLRQEIQGNAFVIYIVDTTGVADSSSLQVVKASHTDFVEAVRKALPRMRFRPAILSGQKVRQLVQQNFAFKIQKPDTLLTPLTRQPQ